MTSNAIVPREKWAPFKKKLTELKSLEPGWCGPGSVPVSPECADMAFNIGFAVIAMAALDTPQVVPGPDGAVQLEWHKHGLDIEVDISVSGVPPQAGTQ